MSNPTIDEFQKKCNEFCNKNKCEDCALNPFPRSAETPAIVGFGMFNKYFTSRACREEVMRSLAAANKKIDEANAKAEKAKRKKQECANRLAYAIKVERRDLEYRNKRDVAAVYVSPDAYQLLTSAGVTGCCLVCGESSSYPTIYGMRLEPCAFLKGHEFMMAFKTAANCLKEDDDG